MPWASRSIRAAPECPRRRQPRAADRQPGASPARASTTARTEQCAGGMRHGRAAQCIHRLSTRDRTHRYAANSSRPWGQNCQRRTTDVIEMLNAAHAGTLKGCGLFGENPAMSDRIPRHVARFLERLDFLVVQDIFMTETAACRCGAARRLFCRKGGTFTNTERRVQRVRKGGQPPARPARLVISANWLDGSWRRRAYTDGQRAKPHNGAACDAGRQTRTTGCSTRRGNLERTDRN